PFYFVLGGFLFRYYVTNLMVNWILAAEVKIWGLFFSSCKLAFSPSYCDWITTASNLRFLIWEIVFVHLISVVIMFLSEWNSGASHMVGRNRIIMFTIIGIWGFANVVGSTSLFIKLLY